MTMTIMNQALRNYRLVAGTLTLHELVQDPGDVVQCTIALVALNGAPTSYTLTPTFNLGPYEHHGFNLNASTNAVGIPWVTVDLTTAFPGIMPANWAQFTGTTLTSYGVGAQQQRQITIPAGYNLLQLQLVASFVAGTTPSLDIDVTFSVTK